MKFVFFFLLSSSLFIFPFRASSSGGDSRRVAPGCANPPSASAEDLALGILTDPAELSLIEGLDEPWSASG